MNDVDYVICLNKPTVANVVEKTISDNVSLLIVQDESTNPGYVKLQLVINGEPQFDDSGRVVAITRLLQIVEID